jgi:16S rRNA (uracil1498-N3)-methyltransferase
MASFFDPKISSLDKFFQLTEEESRHICRVLRLKDNDLITLLDGRGRSFSCSIAKADPKKCVVKINRFTEDPRLQFDLHLAVAPTKNIDRIEWFVEKATEIGITEFTFIQCQNSERNKMNEERIRRILVSAMKQSKRTYLPIFRGLTSFSDFVKSRTNGCIAYCGEGDKMTLDASFKLTSCPILIGPEGDFHPEEVNLALNQGYKIITLGKHRLRTETAALVACVQAAAIIEHSK